jgi:hypothetical protein
VQAKKRSSFTPTGIFGQMSTQLANQSAKYRFDVPEKLKKILYKKVFSSSSKILSYIRRREKSHF